MLYLVNFRLRKSHYMGKTEFEDKQRLVAIPDEVIEYPEIYAAIETKLNLQYYRGDTYSLDVSVENIEFEDTL